MAAPNTDFLPIATGVGALVATQAAYAGNAVINYANGYQVGIVDPATFNKSWRQGTFPIAAFTSFVSQVLGGAHVQDDGNLPELETQFWQAFLASGYFPDIGSTNALLTANPTGLTFPAPFVGMRVTVVAANAPTGASTLNWMGTGNVAIVFGDGTPVRAGAWSVGTLLDLEFNGTAWQLVSVPIGAIRGPGTTFNTITQSTTTRVSMSGTGTTPVTAWTPTNYIKQSATSTLRVSLNAPTYTPASPGVGCSSIILNVGATALEQPCANNTSSDSRGTSIILADITGIAAGSLPISVQYVSFSGGSWTTVFCPNSGSDASYLPALTGAFLTIEEIGP